MLLHFWCQNHVREVLYTKCAPSKYVYTLIPENSAYINLRGKLDSAVVIKLETLTWEIILNLTGESDIDS